MPTSLSSGQTAGVLSLGVGRSEECAQEFAPQSHIHSGLNQQDLMLCFSCVVKKHADLLGSFLYSQSTMKDMYSTPTNRTELSIPMKTKALRGHSVYIQTEERSGKETTRMFLNS